MADKPLAGAGLRGQSAGLPPCVLLERLARA